MDRDRKLAAAALGASTALYVYAHDWSASALFGCACLLYGFVCFLSGAKDDERKKVQAQIAEIKSNLSQLNLRAR